MDPITYSYTGQITPYTVQTTGNYTLTAFGAQGGGQSGFSTGGLGASVSGNFSLQGGTQLLFLVGGQGVNGTAGQSAAGGGGGGSFIYLDADRSGTISAGDVLLLAAGGGGGGGGSNTFSNGVGGTGTNSGSGNGGLGGNGGGSGGQNGGGGAGINGPGLTGNGASSGAGAANIQSGGAGGNQGGSGGYGGGGGGSLAGGGGGGGYSGGNGGSGSAGGNSRGLGGFSYFNTAQGTQTSTSDATNAGNGRILAPAPAPCYVTGTCIRVLRGLTIEDVPVERLRVGDLALTAAGKPRPIRWIGTRSYPGLSAPKHDRPVRIRAGALADGVPARDLRVSPDHCLWLDGLLVAAGHLVNGTSITRGAAVADLTYWHIELDSHDMLLAEGAAAESFLAAPGVRSGFEGAHRPDPVTAPAPCAPRVEPGPELTALRKRLIARAGLSVEPVRHGSMRGWFDRCDAQRLAGWAQDLAHPNGRVCLDVVVDGAVVAMTIAEQYRADIAAAGVGDGCHGFDFDLDEPLAPGMAHTVELRRTADGERVCAMAVDTAGAWTPLLAA